MLARLCDAPELRAAWLVHAKFTRLTDRLVDARQRTRNDAAGAVIGSVEFAVGDGMTIFDLVERPEPAPAASRPPTLGFELAPGADPLGGVCRFVDAVGIEGLLDALVQSIKSLHQALPEPTCDIWFTGLRQWRLPVGAATEPVAGRIDIECLRRNSAGGRHQSLLRASIACDEHCLAADGLVTFAWRTPGAADVA